MKKKKKSKGIYFDDGDNSNHGLGDTSGVLKLKAGGIEYKPKFNFWQRLKILFTGRV